MLAIILDGTVYSAPRIKDRISGGDAQISGSFTLDEAKDLAIVLRAGALPAPLKTLQNLTVGLRSAATPSMPVKWLDFSHHYGDHFMIFYYRLSGLIADLALVLNLVLLMGAMAALTQRLPCPASRASFLRSAWQLTQTY